MHIIWEKFRLNDDDIAVMVKDTGGNQIIFLFRKVDDDIRMVGFWAIYFID
jgi:hypothetical protein